MADGNNATPALKSFIERIERLESEKAEIGADVKEVYAEAKSSGLDPKIMRIIVRRRKMDAAVRQEQDALVDTYSAALGMLPDEDDDQ